MGQGEYQGPDLCPGPGIHADFSYSESFPEFQWTRVPSGWQVSPLVLLRCPQPIECGCQASGTEP